MAAQRLTEERRVRLQPEKADRVTEAQFADQSLQPRPKRPVADQTQLDAGMPFAGSQPLARGGECSERVLVSLLLSKAGGHQQADRLVGQKLPGPERDRVHVHAEVV